MKFILLSIVMVIPAYLAVYKFNFNWGETIVFGILYGTSIAGILNIIY